MEVVLSEALFRTSFFTNSVNSVFYTLSLHDALPICRARPSRSPAPDDPSRRGTAVSPRDGARAGVGDPLPHEQARGELRRAGPGDRVLGGQTPAGPDYQTRQCPPSVRARPGGPSGDQTRPGSKAALLRRASSTWPFPREDRRRAQALGPTLRDAPRSDRLPDVSLSSASGGSAKGVDADHALMSAGLTKG